MALVTRNPDFIPSVGLGAEAGVEAMVDVYLPAIAFELSSASGPRTGRQYVIPLGSRQYESDSAVGDHEKDEDMFGEVIGRIHIASAENEPPAELTGTLRRSGGVNRFDAPTSATADIGPNAVNPDDGGFYGQELELEMKRPAWRPVLKRHFGIEGDGLLEGSFVEGFVGSAA